MPLLDTSFIVDVMEGRAAARDLFRLLVQGSAPVGVSPFTQYELYRGVGRSSRPEEESQKVERLLRSLVVFPFEPEAARHAGLLDAQMISEGRKISLLDLLIAAVAVHHGEAVVTGNTRDFERVPGIKLLRY